MTLDPRDAHGVHRTTLEPADRRECDACGAYLILGELVWTNAWEDFVACSRSCAQRLERRRADRALAASASAALGVDVTVETRTIEDPEDTP